MAQQASLFGPSAEELMYAQQLADQERQQQQYMATLGAVKGDVPGFATGYALGYGGGQSLGQAVRGLFGQDTKMADPRIAKAQQLESLMQGMSGTDLNDPTKLQDVAAQLQKAGRFQEALYFSDRASALATAERELAAKELTARNKSAFDAAALNPVLTQLRQTTKDVKGEMTELNKAREVANIMKRNKREGKETNSAVRNVLDTFLAKAIGDARLSDKEVERVGASGGSIGRRVADKISRFMTGQDTDLTEDDKIEILNSIEVVLNQRYAQERKALSDSYQMVGVPTPILDVNLPEIQLSPSAQEYFDASRATEDASSWTMTRKGKQ